MFNPDVVREHAKLAAHYFQALLVEGVGPDVAAVLTNNYVTFHIIREQQAATTIEAAQASVVHAGIAPLPDPMTEKTP